MHELRRVFVNEWMKLMYRWRLWVTVGLAVLVVMGVSMIGFREYQRDPARHFTVERLPTLIKQADQKIKEWQQELQDPKSKRKSSEIKEDIFNMTSMKESLQNGQEILLGNWRPVLEKNLKELTQYLNDKKSKKENIEIYSEKKGSKLQLEYQLKQREGPLPYWEDSSYEKTRQIHATISPLLLPLLVVILVADMVSGERTSGTIKLLLVRPVSRLKILLGKWLVSLTATIVLVISLYGLLFLINLALYGSLGAFAPQMVGATYTFEWVSAEIPGTPKLLAAILNLEHVTIIPQWQYILIGAFLTMVSMMTVATITFLCSTLFKSSVISTGVSFVVIFVCQLVQWMIPNGKWIGWLFTVHLDLLSNWSGQLSHELKTNLTLSTGMLILAVWTIVSITIAAAAFHRKDVLSA